MKKIIFLGFFLILVSSLARCQTQQTPLGLSAQMSVQNLCNILGSITGYINKTISENPIQLKNGTINITKVDIPTPVYKSSGSDSVILTFNNIQISIDISKVISASFDLTLGLSTIQIENNSYIQISQLVASNFPLYIPKKTRNLINEALQNVSEVLNSALQGDTISVGDNLEFVLGVGGQITTQNNTQKIQTNIIFAKIQLLSGAEVCNNIAPTVQYEFFPETALISSQFVNQLLCILYQSQLISGGKALGLEGLTTTTLNILFPSLNNIWPGSPLFINTTLSNQSSPQFYFRGGRVEIGFPIQFGLIVKNPNFTSSSEFNFTSTCLNQETQMLDTQRCNYSAEINSYPVLLANLWFGEDNCLGLNINNLVLANITAVPKSDGVELNGKQFSNALNGAIQGLLPTINYQLNGCIKKEESVRDEDLDPISQLVRRSLLGVFQPVETQEPQSQNFLQSYNGYVAIGVSTAQEYSASLLKNLIQEEDLIFRLQNIFEESIKSISLADLEAAGVLELVSQMMQSGLI